MADADSRGDVLKSLGVQRRRAGGEEPAAAEAAAAVEAPAAEPPAATGLGIKRRRPAEDEPEGGGASKPGGGGAAGLGIKRRRPAGEQADGGAAPEADKGGAGLGIKRRKEAQEPVAEEAAAAELPPDPLAPVRGKLGNDECALLLANFLRTRPDLIEENKLPERLWELQRTHGRYLGDGRPERKIPIGWRPAYVLFTLPAYPDGPPTYNKADWTFTQPGPNRQPHMVDDGFVVDARYNLPGEWFFYVVFKDDGQPLETAPAEEPAAAPRERSGTGLGIRRRR